MKKIRLITVFTLIFFCWFMVAVPLESAASSSPAKGSKETEKSADKETGSGATLEKNSHDSDTESGMVERTGKSVQKEVKKKKFPWLIVAVVAVTGAALFYFLVINKKYTLTTTVGEGIEGSPAAGTQKFKKNETVAYQYSLKSGYKDLVVKLDGAIAAASGSIKMDRNHTLDASATQAAQVSVNSTPSGAQVYADGTNTGKTTPCTLSFASSGSHAILVRRCGYKDYTVTVQAVMGTDTPVNVVLTAGHKEDFDVEAASCWQPGQASEWKVASGSYSCASNVAFNTYNVLNYQWPDSNYTIRVRMLRHLGQMDIGNAIILISDLNTLPVVKGYCISVSEYNKYSILRMDSANLITGSGGLSWIKPTTITTAVNGGLDAWNDVRIVRNGGSYAYYINDKLVWSYTGETTYDPRYVGLVIGSKGTYTEVNFDYVYVDLGTSAGMVLGSPVIPIPASGGSSMLKK